MSSIPLHPQFGLNPSVAVCYLCGQDKNEIVLLGARYKGEAPHRGIYDKTPCEACKGFMEKGVILISCKKRPDAYRGENPEPYRTGGWVVITEEAAKRMFSEGAEVLRTRVAFVEDEAWDKIGLPRPDSKAEAVEAE